MPDVKGDRYGVNSAPIRTGEPDPDTRNAGDDFTAFMSKEDELRIGAEEHPKMIKEFGGAYADAKLRAYIRRIGLKLAGFSEARDLPYTFTILNNDKVNAFALPGGYVYITRGLLALAENEAEKGAPGRTLQGMQPRGGLFGQFGRERRHVREGGGDVRRRTDGIRSFR